MCKITTLAKSSSEQPFHRPIAIAPKIKTTTNSPTSEESGASAEFDPFVTLQSSQQEPDILLSERRILPRFPVQGAACRDVRLSPLQYNEIGHRTLRLIENDFHRLSRFRNPIEDKPIRLRC
jgi:hypothetical protein